MKIPEKSVIPHQDAAGSAIREGRPQPEIIELLRKIPSGNVKIKSFEFNSVRYQLFESPVTEATGIVNFWSSTKVDAGQLIRGKPFARYFVVIADSLSIAASFALGPIPNIPVGFNKPRVVPSATVQVKKEKSEKKDKKESKEPKESKEKKKEHKEKKEAKVKV